ncbi:NUDIX hydrolase [Nitritalea halalkaliphila LW7]|uniref:NUDIX hydrolase n=1 Tax=Nitritalea halalkaliphila LW7 TaxID=1189621 RepID=I5C3P5_9BACT|nr:NUDIX hydrolase [Nitritalea halalkaliphila]EIM76447.1 NUDIX hydrolase [Nitritalea halalkaliphila LW7]
MSNIQNEIDKTFGHRLRTRVNGVLIEEGKVLLLCHRMGPERLFWNVPGGGMEFGSSARENLRREFREETGLEVRVGAFLGVHEYLEPPLHAVELFFQVERVAGEPMLGKDPEMPENKQLLEELRFMDAKNIAALPQDAVHQLFWGIKTVNDVLKWKGYFKFEK